MSKKALFNTSGSSISSFSTVLGSTLVLTMLGVLFIFLLVANAITQHFRSQLTVQVMLKDNAPEEQVLDLKKKIEGEDYAGSVLYTSKAKAAEIMQQELDEEFVDFLGYNPLPASLDIHINPEFEQLDSLSGRLAALEKNEWVREVNYEKGLLQQVNENIAKWGIGLLMIGALFLIIAVVLIVNTIELAIFSQRFIIKSMQLVGATHWFIQKPFLKRGLWYGLISAIFAIALISAILFFFREELKDVVTILMTGSRYLVMVGAIVFTGLMVSWLATAYAVRRFVKLRQEELY
ncbi:MAG: hypothetical protein IT223_12715 [Crocinitomicaceae bacterium]|nr:hypothetical protein [Crocinitomicaceae bacterium]